jgi:hypothetical protein
MDVLDSLINQASSVENNSESAEVTRFYSTSSSPKEVQLIFIVRNGIDRFNIEFDETSVYVKLLSNTTLETVNTRLLSRLGIDGHEDFVYTRKVGRTTLDASKTIEDLGLSNNDTVYVDGHRRVIRNARICKLAEDMSMEEPIELVCTTRVGSEDGSLRKIKVLVKPSHFCHDMLEEISALFGRTGLKFKCGRVVLRGGNRAVYLLTA